MTKTWLTSSELCDRWKMKIVDLVILFRDEKISGYDLDDETEYVKNEGLYYAISLIDGITGSTPIPPTAEQISKYIFRHSEVEAYERRHNIVPAQASQTMGSTTTEPGVLDPQEANETTRKFLSAAGRKGGSKSKVNEPILAAITQYMVENPKIHSMSNEDIAKRFCNKHTEDKPRVVEIEQKEHAVSCSGKLIFSRIHESHDNRPNNIVKSIKYSTFRNVYVPKAKKSIMPDPAG